MRTVGFGVLAGSVELALCALLGGRVAALWCAAIIGLAVGVVAMVGGAHEANRSDSASHSSR